MATREWWERWRKQQLRMRPWERLWLQQFSGPEYEKDRRHTEKAYRKAKGAVKNAIDREYDKIALKKLDRKKRASELHNLFGSPPGRLPDKFHAAYDAAINELARQEYTDAQLLEYHEIAKGSTRIKRHARSIPWAIREPLRTIASLHRASGQPDAVLERAMTENEKKARRERDQQSNVGKTGVEKRARQAANDERLCQEEARKIWDRGPRRPSDAIRDIQRKARNGDIEFSEKKIPSEAKVRRAIMKLPEASHFKRSRKSSS